MFFSDRLLDAVAHSVVVDHADDFDQEMVPSVGSIVHYHAYGGTCRVVRVTHVHEEDPERGVPTFEGFCLGSTLLYEIGNECWGYWRQIKEVLQR